MLKAKLAVIATSSIVVFTAVTGVRPLLAQQPGLSREMLQRADLSAPGRELLMARVEIDPGAVVGKHTHPGEEVGYVLEGTLVLEVEGKTPVTLNAGDYYLVPAGLVHDGRNAGNTKARAVTTYIVEKGKPLATPVK
jgi:quercetin dioxygenase-like cupin family protein